MISALLVFVNATAAVLLSVVVSGETKPDGDIHASPAGMWKIRGLLALVVLTATALRFVR